MAGPPPPPAIESSPPASPERPAPLPGPRYSILAPRLDRAPGGPGNAAGRGGTERRGDGAGATGKLLDGQVPIPIDTIDPRYADYFLELKKRIEANWSYPEEAIRARKTGHGVVGFVLRKDGSVREVAVLSSSGVPILDRFIGNAIRFASPFPPIPGNMGEDVLPISVNFQYILGGLKVFGFQ
jgi:protein TonB